MNYVLFVELGFHGNHDNYYDPLVTMIEHGIQHRFVRPAIRGVLSVVTTGTAAIDALLAHEPGTHDAASFLPMHAGRDVQPNTSTPKGPRA